MRRRVYLPNGKTRSARITIRVTPEFKVKVERLAYSKGINSAQLIESLLAKQIDKA